jgi:hypothetical protein
MSENNNAHRIHSKDLRIKSQKDDTQGTNDTQRKTSITASQNGTQNNDVNNDAHRNSQTTARIWKNHKSVNKRI